MSGQLAEGTGRICAVYHKSPVWNTCPVVCSGLYVACRGEFGRLGANFCSIRPRRAPLKHAPTHAVQPSALLPTPAFDTMLLPRTGVETSLGTAGMNACATYFAQETGIRPTLWGRLATCGGLATRRPFLVNRPAGAGCQPARRIASCPTINAGCSASRKLSGIGHSTLFRGRAGVCPARPQARPSCPQNG